MSTERLRSTELLRLAIGQPCTIGLPCCVKSPCCCAHSNQSIHGKGRGIKADDCWVAFACEACHYQIDQGKTLNRAEKIAAWTRGHLVTWPIVVRLLLASPKQTRPRAEPSRGTALTSSKIVPRNYA